VDIPLFAMASSLCSLQFARLGSVGVNYTHSPAGSSLAFSGLTRHQTMNRYN